MRAERWTTLLAGALVVLAGCGGGATPRATPSQQSQEPHIGGAAFRQPLQPQTEAQAEEFDFHGWQALRLSNGLVTVIAVPAAGGRILSYQLGDHEYLWQNPDLLGKTFPSPQTEEERAWHNFGGDKVWPAPQAEWGGPPDPLGGALDGAEWRGEIVTTQGVYAEIQMASPEDEKIVGLQATRKVRLYAGTTRLQVTDTFKNVSDQPIEWSIWTVTQMVGSYGTGAPGGEVRAYVPMTPDKDHPEGFWALMDTEDQDQYQALEERLLEVVYQGQTGKVGVRATEGWIASSESVSNHVYVRRFPTRAGGEYPDGGSLAQVYSYGYAEGTVGCLELETLSPLQELEPGEEFSFVQDWYAAMVPGPIVDTTEFAAINQPLTLEAAEEGFRLQGSLGMFAPGNLLISVLDASGQPTGEPITVKVTPDQPVTLDRQVAAGLGATAVRLTLENENGTPLGQVAQVPVPNA